MVVRSGVTTKPPPRETLETGWPFSTMTRRRSIVHLQLHHFDPTTAPLPNGSLLYRGVMCLRPPASGRKNILFHTRPSTFTDVSEKAGILKTPDLRTGVW